MNRRNFCGVLLAAALAMPGAGCNKARATIEYDLDYLDTDYPDVHIEEQAMGSGVVSGFGYNDGVYVVSYHRLVLPTGELRDIFLTFDVPAHADNTLVRNLLVTDTAYVRYEELTPAGDVLLVSEEPTKAEFCVRELFMNDKGEPGGEIYFEIELPTRAIRNGIFTSDDTAEDVAESASELTSESGTRVMQWAASKCR